MDNFYCLHINEKDPGSMQENIPLKQHFVKHISEYLLSLWECTVNVFFIWESPMRRAYLHSFHYTCIYTYSLMYNEIIYIYIYIYIYVCVQLLDTEFLNQKLSVRAPYFYVVGWSVFLSVFDQFFFFNELDFFFHKMIACHLIHSCIYRYICEDVWYNINFVWSNLSLSHTMFFPLLFCLFVYWDNWVITLIFVTCK